MHRYLIVVIFAFLQACSGIEYDPTKDWSAKDFYDEARYSLDAGEFQNAIRYLETLEARFPFDPYAKQAQLDIAYSYYKFDEPESAISAANRFQRLHPRDPHIDYVYYLKGLVNFKRGEGLLQGWFPRDHSDHDEITLRTSFNEFATLVRRFPDSFYAGDAFQRMVYLRNKIAEKDIKIAEFYTKRKAWVAAANRAKGVVQKYQETVWTIRALEIMKVSYEELGLDDLAADVKRIMEINKLKSFDTEISNPEVDDALVTPPNITPYKNKNS